MRIYVAGPVALWATVREVQNFLRDIGHSITHDWTVDAEHYCKTGGTTEKPGDLAMYCNIGVENADCVVALFSTLVPMQGTWVEVGIAIGQDKPVLAMLGGDEHDERRSAWLQRAVFLHHPCVTVHADLAGVVRALEALRNGY